VLRHRELSVFFSRLAWTANLGGSFSMSMVFHLLPRLMVDLEISANDHGWLIMFCRVCVLSTYVLLYRLAFWHYRFYFPLVTQLLAVAGLVIVVLAQSIWQIGLGLAALGVLVGYNYFASLYYSTAGGGPERQGLVSGIHEASLGVGFAMGSIAGGLFARLAEAFDQVLPPLLVQRSPYVLAISVIAALLVLQGRMYRRRREEMRGKRTALSSKTSLCRFGK
jgi:predicted MFS family arabinose efflux permease